MCKGSFDMEWAKDNYIRRIWYEYKKKLKYKEWNKKIFKKEEILHKEILIPGSVLP